MTSKAYIELPRRALTSDERYILKCFQEVLGHLQNFYIQPNREKFEILCAELVKYDNLSFMSSMRKWIAKISRYFKTVDNARSKEAEARSEVSRIAAIGTNAILTKDIAMLVRVGKIAARINEIIRTSSGNERAVFANRHQGPFYIQNPYFFQTTDFLKMFEDEEIAEVCNIETHSVQTYMDIPDSDNFQHWALQLSNNSQPAKLNANEFNQWIKLTYIGDIRFDNLLSKVKQYLHSNRKELIPDIADEMRQFPELMEVHSKIIDDITVVYRGIPFHEDDDDYTIAEIISHDAKRKYIATSKSKRVAERFANSRGHLETEGRTDGVVLSYRVNPASIVLDTSVFGAVFGEAEVIINSNKATVIDTDYIYDHSG